HRAQISDRSVSAFRIVEALDVVEYISSRLTSGPVRFAPCAIGLQRREDALHRGIVPDVARTAHRTDDAVIGHQLLELLAGILAATVGMMQQRIGLPRRQIAITRASLTSCAGIAAQ